MRFGVWPDGAGSAAGRNRDLERAHRISQIAYAGLVLILVGLMAFAVGGAYVAQTAVRNVDAAIHETRGLVQAQYWLATEESVERLYRLKPSAIVRAQHQHAASELVASLRRSPPSALAVPTLQAAERYDSAALRLFDAIDAHQLALASLIDDRDDDTAFAEVERDINLQAAYRRTRADDALTALRRTEDTILTMNSVLSVVGLVLLAVVLAVLRHYRRVVGDALKAELNRFKQASLTDYLTGLGNHRAYQEDMSRNVAACAADGSVVTLALVDVDELKVVNDRSGHVTGDRLLASLAHLLRLAGPGSVAYRLGGDEFALMFPSVAAEAAKERMEHVRKIVEAQMNGLTVSVGVSTSSTEDPNLLIVREQADAALYEAKRRGRNGVVAFDEIRDEHPVFLPARVQEVRDIITNGAIGVAFQPIWSIDGRAVLGYEALARPIGDDPINPQDAFDIAERIGKAHELDRVCRMAILAKAVDLPPDSLLFLNISPQSLAHGDLGPAFARAVEAAGLEPNRIVLEITERSLARLDVVVREAAYLRTLGFLLALDDAGSGNSGLEMLSKLAVDFVKIDREVIVCAEDNPGGRGVLAGIIAIAREMRALVIAEGIEDAGMLELVRDATRFSQVDCAVQGYYLGRPKPGFVDAREAGLVRSRLQHAPAMAGTASVRVAS